MSVEKILNLKNGLVIKLALCDDYLKESSYSS